MEYINRQVPRAWRATGQSLFWAAYFGAGGILGNALGGFLSDRVGIQGMYRLSSVLILVAALAATVLLRERGYVQGGVLENI